MMMYTLKNLEMKLLLKNIRKIKKLKWHKLKI